MIQSDISKHLNVSELPADSWWWSVSGQSGRQEMKCGCKVERRRSRTHFWRYHYTDSCCVWASILPMKLCSWLWICADVNFISQNCWRISSSVREQDGSKKLLNRSLWDLAPRDEETRRYWVIFAVICFWDVVVEVKTASVSISSGMFSASELSNQYDRSSPEVWIQSNHSRCECTVVFMRNRWSNRQIYPVLPGRKWPDVSSKISSFHGRKMSSKSFGLLPQRRLKNIQFITTITAG